MLTTLILLLFISILLQGLIEFGAISYRLSSVQADTHHTYELASSAVRHLVSETNEKLQDVPQKINQYYNKSFQIDWESISYRTEGDLYTGFFVQEISIQDCLIFYIEYLNEWEKEGLEYGVIQKQEDKTIETVVYTKLVLEESFSKEKVLKYNDKLLVELLKQKDVATIEAIATTRNIQTDQILTTEKVIAPLRLYNIEKTYFKIDEEYNCENLGVLQQYLSALEPLQEGIAQLEAEQLLKMQYENKEFFREFIQSLGLMDFENKQGYQTSIGKACGMVLEKKSPAVYKNTFVYLGIRSIYSVKL